MKLQSPVSPKIQIGPKNVIEHFLLGFFFSIRPYKEQYISPDTLYTPVSKGNLFPFLSPDLANPHVDKCTKEILIWLRFKHIYCSLGCLLLTISSSRSRVDFHTGHLIYLGSYRVRGRSALAQPAR